MKKFLKMLTVLALTVSVMASCSTEDEKDNVTKDTTSVTQSVSDGKELKVGVSISTLNNPFFVSLKEGIEEAAKEGDVKIVITDAQNDSEVQNNNIEDLIEQKVDMLLINPVDSQAISPAVENANQKNIPVICVDRNSESGEVVSLVASDNVEGGKMAAEFLIEKLGENAKVIELEGIAGASSTRERGEGFNEAIKGKLDLIASQPANFDRSEGLSVMENLYQAHPDVQAVFCQNDEMALGAAEALANSDVLIVGFDGTEDAIKAVENGQLAATIAQKPKEMGKIAMQNAVKYLKGEKIESKIASPLELIKK